MPEDTKTTQTAPGQTADANPPDNAADSSGKPGKGQSPDGKQPKAKADKDKPGKDKPGKAGKNNKSEKNSKSGKTGKPAKPADDDDAGAAGAHRLMRTDDRALGGLLTIAARVHRARMAELLAGVGLYPGQEQVLQFLADVTDPSMSELADALTVKAPTISKTIGRLTQQGLVERKTGEADARLVRVTLTAAGRERVGQLAAIAERLEEEMTRGFDGKDRKRLRRLLRKASKNLARASGRRVDATALLEPDESDDSDA